MCIAFSCHLVTGPPSKHDLWSDRHNPLLHNQRGGYNIPLISVAEVDKLCTHVNGFHRTFSLSPSPSSSGFLCLAASTGPGGLLDLLLGGVLRRSRGVERLLSDISCHETPEHTQSSQVLTLSQLKLVKGRATCRSTLQAQHASR